MWMQASTEPQHPPGDRLVNQKKPITSTCSELQATMIWSACRWYARTPQRGSKKQTWCGGCSFPRFKMLQDGRTALHWAAIRGSEPMVQMLLEAQADIDVKATNGRSALAEAQLRGYHRIIQMLRAAGAKTTEHPCFTLPNQGRQLAHTI
eukprot:TRINITY_DN4011_c0_g1_i4.p2 TRINITY_DN4011_c0_g1~~TRINITY_DN4011_c0_g1_i4.p2  ORF type:complete len:150 (-),score=21.05 TRINITY_DN4011_c0_g1_i4:311-760(-)